MMTRITVSIFCCILLVSGIFGTEPQFAFPAPSDSSTSDPYEIFLANTFPLEISTIYSYPKKEYYEKLVDVKIGTPLYAGMNVASSRQILIESFFTHFRTLDSTKKSVVASETCQTKDSTNSTMMIPSNRRIKSIFHEINLPFQVPCYSCRQTSLTGPNFFSILQKRNIFASDNLLTESVPVYDFMKEKINIEGKMQIFAADISPEDGSFRWSPSLSPELGKIGEHDLINSEFEPVTKVNENGMSLFCSKEQNGFLNPPEIIVNVDTLRIPPNETLVLSKNNNEEETLLFSSKPKESHRFTIGDLTIWKDYPNNKWPKIIDKFNLKVDIFWEEWSCCNACCCSAFTCGIGYDANKAACQRISSNKNRRGFLSVFKNDPQKPIKILDSIELMLRGTDLYNETVEYVAEAFNLYLSSAPYAFTGIPVHSTLLQTDRTWLILEAFLNRHFEYRIGAELGSEMGLFVDSQSCENDPQKMNCSILQQCFDNEVNGASMIDQSYIPPPPSDEHHPTDHYHSESDQCDYQGIEDILLKEKETVVDVDEELSFRFAVDEREYGELLSVKWKVGQSKIAVFDAKKPCSSQRIFFDQLYLTVLKVENHDTNLPYIAKATLKATGEEIMLKLSLKFKAKAVPSKFTNQILKWVGIAGGVLAVFIIVVIIVHIIQVRSLKRKLKQAAAAKTKTNDQV